MFARLRNFLLPSPLRRTLAGEFRTELHKQASVLHLPGGLIAAVAWLGFALDTDVRLHPEFPELVYFRIALSALAGLLVLVVLHDRLRGRTILRGRGLGWMYAIVGYVLLATSFFTGRIADDPNYVSGLQIVVMLVVFVPFPRRVTYSLYAASIVLFIASVILFHPDLSTFKAQYSMQNLGIAYVLSLIMTFILDRYRFNIFANHKEVVTKSRQIQEQMQQVRTLKEQQDGDYFLTANLIKPLIRNETDGSGPIRVEFMLDQKKKFSFRSWSSELGGDYLYADTVTLSDLPYVVFINGDAMGKSVQGAGGALVLGTVFRSLLTRTQHSPAYRRKFPERWLKDAFVELQDVFITFDGTMLISCIIGLLEEHTGMLYFINAEHPHPVLFREGRASFVETTQVQRKLGTQGVESKLQVQALRLIPEDILILGSDGRDDLLIGVDSAGGRIINEDEHLFAQLVERAGGDLARISGELERAGQLTDDLSLMRIAFREDSMPAEALPPEALRTRSQALQAAADGASEAEPLLQQALAFAPEDAELLSAAADSSKRRGDWQGACEFLDRSCRAAPESSRYLLLAAAAYRRRFTAERRRALLETAADYGERLRLREPGHPGNLIQLADTYRLLGSAERARKVLAEGRALRPDDPRIARLAELLETP